LQPDQPPSIPAVKSIPLLLTLPAVLAGLLAGCKPDAVVVAPKPPEVIVATVTKSNVPIIREWVGTLDGLVNASIRAQVSGYLLAQYYHEGEPVTQGALLFELDDRTYKAALDQALAKLGKTELDVKRLTPLAEKEAVSRQDLDDAIQANLANQAAVDEARLNIEFTKIVAPINGIAGIAQAQVGNLVGPNSGDLTTVSTVDPIKAYFTVSEQEYLAYERQFAAAAGDRGAERDKVEFELLLSDGTVYELKGKFFAADRQVDRKTGALRLAAVFENPGNLLRPGQFARVRASIGVRENALLVPQRAVTEVQGAYTIAVVGDDNKVTIRPVKVGERRGSEWIIESGLKAGERVVSEGTQKVRDGITVVAKAAATPESETPKISVRTN
jgi:RND family efflux transporter MFP subunit